MRFLATNLKSLNMRNQLTNNAFNPIQDGPFRGCCYKYPTMMKIRNNTSHEQDPKNIKITWQTTYVLLISAFFHRKSETSVISKNMNIDFILIHNSNSSKSLKAVVINMVAILMMSAKLAILGLLKIKVF